MSFITLPVTYSRRSSFDHFSRRRMILVFPSSSWNSVTCLTERQRAMCLSSPFPNTPFSNPLCKAGRRGRHERGNWTPYGVFLPWEQNMRRLFPSP